jgi:ABC-type branched-subunit amino acid transport system permease subunit
VLPTGLLEYRWVFIPLLLIILMFWKPYGLMANKESKLLGIDKAL